MHSKLKELFPAWYAEIDLHNNYLVMTDDLDSFYSCQKLNSIFGVQIGGFYSFESGLHICNKIAEGKEPIFIDMSISRGKCFDNHYTFIENPEAINPNVVKRKYHQKYNGSTLAVILSLFDCMDELTEEKLTALLCIDGFFRGYYQSNGFFRDINLYWFKALGITDYVLPILENHDFDYFMRFAAEAQLSEKIFISESNKLYSALDIELPNEIFELVLPTKKQFVTKDNAIRIYNADNSSVLVSNEAFKNKYVLNLIA